MAGFSLRHLSEDALSSFLLLLLLLRLLRVQDGLRKIRPKACLNGRHSICALVFVSVDGRFHVMAAAMRITRLPLVFHGLGEVKADSTR